MGFIETSAASEEQTEGASDRYLDWADYHYRLIQAYRDALNDVDDMGFQLGRRVLNLDSSDTSGAVFRARPAKTKQGPTEDLSGATAAFDNDDSASPLGLPEEGDVSWIGFGFNGLKAGFGSAKTHGRTLGRNLNRTVDNSIALPSASWRLYSTFAGYLVFAPLVKRQLRLHIRSVLRILGIEYRTETTGINPATAEGNANRQLLGKMLADVTEGLERHTYVAGLPGGQGRAAGFLGGLIPLGIPTSLIVAFWGPVENALEKLFVATTEDGVTNGDWSILGDQLLFVGGILAAIVVLGAIMLLFLAQGVAFRVMKGLLEGRDAYKLEQHIFEKLGRRMFKDRKLYMWQSVAYVLVVSFIGIVTWWKF